MGVQNEPWFVPGVTFALGLFSYLFYRRSQQIPARYQKTAQVQGGEKCGGSLIAETLKEHGVKFVFTLCGGHISPILVHSKRLGIRIIDVRHEVTTVFAADAVSRLSGVPGVAAVTAGPGLTNTITAVKNAQLAESPLVILAGAAPTMLRGKGALQDINQFDLMKPHCKAFFTCNSAREIVPALQKAFKIAQEGIPGPVCLEFPTDVLYPESLVREFFLKREAKSFFEKVVFWYVGRCIVNIFKGIKELRVGLPLPVPIAAPTSSQVQNVVRALHKAKRPLILVGSQALLGTNGDGSGLAQAVRRIGVPLYCTGMARGLLGRGDPLQSLHKRREAVREADVVLLLGVVTDFRLEYGLHVPGRANLISVNRSRTNLNRGIRTGNTKIVADPKEFIMQMGAVCQDNPIKVSPEWTQTLRKRDDARNAEIAEQASASTDGPGCNPIKVCQTVEKCMSDDALIVADGGDFVGTAAYTLRPRGPLTWLDPGAFGTLGVGGGFALGAALCNPGKEVWLIWGDGTSGYSLAEYDTFKRHNIPIISVIGNDACWNQIHREQINIFNDSVSCMLVHTDYHDVAEGYGGKGFAIRSTEDIEPAIQEAKKLCASGTAVCLNAHLAKSDFRKGSISM